MGISRGVNVKPVNPKSSKIRTNQFGERQLKSFFFYFAFVAVASTAVVALVGSYELWLNYQLRISIQRQAPKIPSAAELNKNYTEKKQELVSEIEPYLKEQISEDFYDEFKRVRDEFVSLNGVPSAEKTNHLKVILALSRLSELLAPGVRVNAAELSVARNELERVVAAVKQ